MGLATGGRYERTPQQLSVVRHVLPERGFRAWLTELRYALAGRVSVPSVVEGLTVPIANLSAVSAINRRQRLGAVSGADIVELNDLLGAEKPTVAARIRNPDAPLYVEDGQLRVGFLLDPEVLRRAASSALLGYCAEYIGPDHKAFRPLEELGELILGSVQSVPDGRSGKYGDYSCEVGFDAFCANPNEYLEGIGRATEYPESMALGPMHAVSSPQPARELARQGAR